MRYYQIALTNPTTGQPIMPSSLLATSGTGKNPTTISSLLPTSTPSNQLTNPAALNIELDIPVYPGHVGNISSFVRIWGLSLVDQKWAQSIDGADIAIYGGMARGYPLANPQQQGLLVKGQVFQAFGNWIGTDMTTDLFIGPPTGQSTPLATGSTQLIPGQALNFIFNWQPGQTLAQALAHTFSIALPSMKQDIQISPQLTTSYQQAGYYATFIQFAQAIEAITAGKLGTSYDGVVMACDGVTVRAWDGTVPPSSNAVKQIAFADLLGQVTAYQPQVLTAKLVMRGDLSIGDIVSFPPGLLTTTSAALTNFQPANKLQFSGPCQIIQMQHFGNYRQPDAYSWNTTVWCTPVTVAQ